jgi:hypothetical protein
VKKLLGKLFGDKSPAPAAPIGRSPRVRIPSIEGAAFVADGGTSYPVRNLSETGLALGSAGADFPGRVSGVLRVFGETTPVTLATVWRRNAEAGATIEDGAAGVRTLLRRAFRDELHALEMTEVDSSRQKTVEVGTPRWFFAPGNFELFYVEHERRLLRLELEWNGNFLALGADGALRFGAVERDAREDPGHARSALVRWADTVPPEQKRKALRIVENIAGLEGAIREKLKELLA